MDFATAVKTGLTKYAIWEGRATRSEFWFFILFDFIASIAALIVDAVLGTSSLFYGMTILALFLPGVSVAVRRLHDTDRSGWWYWISLIPIVGAILLIVWFCEAGTPGQNTFGDDPLDVPGAHLMQSQSASFNDLEKLERLSSLHAKGILTDSEFQTQKAALLR